MSALGSALIYHQEPDAALTVLKAQLATLQRFWPRWDDAILNTRANIANCYDALQQDDKVLRIYRTLYADRLRVVGEGHPQTIDIGCNLSNALINCGLFAEAKPFTGKLLVVARRALGERHDGFLMACRRHAVSLYADPAASQADVLKAEALLVDVLKKTRQIFGPEHPYSVKTATFLTCARDVLARFQP